MSTAIPYPISDIDFGGVKGNVVDKLYKPAEAVIKTLTGRSLCQERPGYSGRQKKVAMMRSIPGAKPFKIPLAPLLKKGGEGEFLRVAMVMSPKLHVNLLISFTIGALETLV